MPVIRPATGSSASAHPGSITFCSGRSAMRPATASASGSAMASHFTRRAPGHTRLSCGRREASGGR